MTIQNFESGPNSNAAHKNMKAKQPKAKTTKSHLAKEEPMKPLWADDKYEKLIDSLNIDAAFKDKLKQAARVTIQIGKRIAEVGKKVVEIIVWAIKKYPETLAVSVVGAVITLVISSIPVVGQALGPIFAMLTLLVAAGVFLNEAVKKHIIDTFKPLT